MKIKTLILSLIIFNTTNAQDIHFSQFDRSAFFLNPSLLSYEDYDCKALLQNRSQWEEVGVPFSTFTLSLERANFISNHSFGIQVLNDLAGDARLKTSGLNVIYSKSLKITRSNLFSFGLGFGVFQRSISYEALIFNTPEEHPNLNFWYPDINAGISIENNISEKLSFNTGIGFFHLYPASQSLIGNNEIKLIAKNNFHLTTRYKLNNKNRINSKCFFSKQRNNQELVVGSEIEHFIKMKKLTTINSGLFYRFKDAIVFQAGVRQDNFGVLFSYDFNTSSLNNASNYQGGTEFSFVYYWDLKKRIKNKPPECCPKYL